MNSQNVVLRTLLRGLMLSILIYFTSHPAPTNLFTLPVAFGLISNIVGYVAGHLAIILGLVGTVVSIHWKINISQVWRSVISAVAGFVCNYILNHLTSWQGYTWVALEHLITLVNISKFIWATLIYAANEFIKNSNNQLMPEPEISQTNINRTNNVDTKQQ